MAGISGISSGASNILSSISQADMGGTQGSNDLSGLANELSSDLKQLMDLVQQLQGGVSQKAAPTHISW